MKILIGADLVPTQSNCILFNNCDFQRLVGKELFDILHSVDYRIFNLETPLTNTKTPILKCGPNLIAGTETIKGFIALGVNLLTLANNHIMDQGKQGFLSTIETLNDSGINYVGGGTNLEDAKKPWIISERNRRIGVYACTEHEFSIASTQMPGANPFDCLETFEHISELKKACNYIIVLYHGGKEHYRYPSPNLQKVCRKLVHFGANLVVCQHSHCIGCEEKYEGGTIVYGQGNFIFDYNESEYWKTSLLIKIADNFEISYIPIIKNGNSVSLAPKEEAQNILEQFRRRSENIKKTDFVEEQYSEFANSMINDYLFQFSGINKGFLYKIVKRITKNKITSFIVSKRFDKKRIVAIQNFIECEAHRELIIKGLSNFVKR